MGAGGGRMRASTLHARVAGVAFGTRSADRARSARLPEVPAWSARPRVSLPPNQRSSASTPFEQAPAPAHDGALVFTRLVFV